jgi:hypothetical protein
MTPTVGRIVYYRHEVQGELFQLPAIITGIMGNGNLCLTVFTFFEEKGTKSVFNVKQGEGVSEWDWMPYQKRENNNA